MKPHPLPSFGLLDFLQVEHWHAVHYHWTPGQEMHGRVKNSTVLWLVEDGLVQLSTSRGNWELRAGDAMLMGVAMERHIATPEGAKWISLRLSAVALDTLDLFSMVPTPVKWRPEAEEWDELLHHAQFMVKHWFPTVPSRQDAHSLSTFLHHQRLSKGHQTPLSNLMCRSAAQVLFALLWKKWGPLPLERVPDASDRHWLPLVLTRLRENPELSVDQLARSLEVSRRHLLRIFRQELHTTPRQFLQQRKLDEGRRLLVSTELELATVAKRAGFESKAHFCRLFKDKFNLTPGEYRHNHRHVDDAV